MKTPQEITDFINSNNLLLDEFNTTNSEKSNFLIGTKNFKSINLYLASLASFVKNLYETIDIQSIVSSVLGLLETSKNVLEINTNITIGTSETQTIGTKIYRINRLSNIEIEITSDNTLNWNVDNIMCFVKDVNGMMVYPVIVTKNNKIKIYFNDLIGSNYTLIWI